MSGEPGPRKEMARHGPRDDLLDIKLEIYNIEFELINFWKTMSPLEKRAWLALWSQCPPYAVYFLVLAAWPMWLTTFLERIAFLAIVAGAHAIAYLIGLTLLKRQERGEELLLDERDHAIDARATRVAYFVMLVGMIVVGVVMPFSDADWKITNTALFAIVLAETVRYALIVLGYRKVPRLAH